MKYIRFTAPLICVAMFTFLASCGGGEQKTAATDSTAVDTTKAAPAPVINTIVTTPQNMVIVIHKVADFAKWKVGYESDDSARLANGIHNYVIGRGLKDSTMVLVALKIDDTAKAKAFAKNPALKKAMQKGGVIGTPTMYFNTATWQDTAIIDTKIRVNTMLNVKDFDAWVKSFEEGKQERLENGIVTRVVGHDLNDSKKVRLVTALTDTAKAFAYYKSDAIKKRMQASGVIGEPVRFIFRIVKRY